MNDPKMINEQTDAINDQTFTRRQILAGLAGAGAVTIVASSPAAGAMKALVAAGSSSNTVLVNVFLRGGADGLNIVVPHGDDDYYRIRGSIAKNKNSLSDLDGFFGLNSDFAPLHSIFKDGEMAFVHATGSNATTRSHFSAMDNMDLGFGNTGWMQRVLAAERASDPVAGISIGKRTSPSLRGAYSGMAFPRLFQFKKTTSELAPMRSALESMYRSADPLTSSATLAAFGSINTLRGVSTSTSTTYPNNGFARDLREAAALIKADVGVRMVSVSLGGWDHHAGQAAKMKTMGQKLSAALAAFKADLGGDSSRVLTVVMSEFGRSARQNGSEGTDHGHGNMMMLMGGGLANAGGGKVHLHNNQWVGLSEDKLYDGRDLAITTDYRSVIAEALDSHMGFNNVGQVFPGFTPQPLGYLGRGSTEPTPNPTTTTTTATTTTMAATTTTAAPRVVPTTRVERPPIVVETPDTEPVLPTTEPAPPTTQRPEENTSTTRQARSTTTTSPRTTTSRGTTTTSPRSTTTSGTGRSTTTVTSPSSTAPGSTAPVSTAPATTAPSTTIGSTTTRPPIQVTTPSTVDPKRIRPARRRRPSKRWSGSGARQRPAPRRNRSWWCFWDRG